MRYRVRFLLTAVWLALPAAIQAQAYQCNVPAELPRPHAEEPTQSEPRRLLSIGGYTLSIIWSPEACHGGGDHGDNLACRSGNRFGFTLHGLWPDGEGAEWPQYCAPVALVPAPLLRKNLCATPSVQLQQHEYAKHGSCMKLPPEAYFARSTGLYAKLRYPDMRALAARKGLTSGQFAAALARANRGVTADMMRLSVNRRGWLEEVWICLDIRFRYVRCPTTQGGAVASTPVKIEAP